MKVLRRLGALLLLLAIVFPVNALADGVIHGGKKRGSATELVPGATYMIEAIVGSVFNDDNGWYMVNTVGYDHLRLYNPAITLDRGVYFRFYDQDGNSQDFESVSSNDQLSWKISFNEWQSQKQACIYIRIEASGWDKEVFPLSICAEGESKNTHDYVPLGDDLAYFEQTPDCMHDGVKVTQKCSLCSKKYKETIPKTDHTPGECSTIVEPTCTQDGLEYVYCAVCNEKISERNIPALGHNCSNWTITTPATYRNFGERSGYCALCYENLTERIDKLSNANILSEGAFDFQRLNDGTARLMLDNSEDAVMEIPNSLSGITVTQIDAGAFAQKESLRELVIPESITEIDPSTFDAFPEVMLVVSRDSYAHHFARSANLNYRYPDSYDWLNS